jgi:hypothetical protein
MRDLPPRREVIPSATPALTFTVNPREGEATEARYGLVASSRDKILETHWGIPSGWHATQRLQLGPWYGEGDGDQRSCRTLTQCVTELGAQGLELGRRAPRLGQRLHPRGGPARPRARTNEYAKRHQRASHVKDPYRLRVNPYRVLLTRGRKGRRSRAFARGAGGAPRHAAVIFVPPDPLCDATAAWLQGHGVKVLADCHSVRA